MNEFKIVIITGFVVLSLFSFCLAVATYLRKRDLNFFGLRIPKEEAKSKEIYRKAYRFETVSCSLISICTAYAAACDALGGNTIFIVPVSILLLICYYLGTFRMKKKIEEENKH